MKVNEIITQKIISELEKGVVPWHKPWISLSPRNLVSKKPYRGINVILLTLMGRESPYWITFKQAMDLGGSVRKGEKGTMVVYYKMNEYLDENAEKEGFLRKVPFLRYYTIFNTDQCDGIEGKVPVITSRIIQPIEECEKIVESYKNKPPMEESTIAAYSPQWDRLYMPRRGAFESPESYYEVLFHEYVHSTGHSARLARKEIEHVKPHGSPDYSREELVAEIGSIFLYSHAGISATFDNSLGYIDHWRKKLSEDPNLILQAASQAQKAYDYILDIKSQENGEGNGN